MATVTVGTIGGVMTAAQLKTALDSVLGADLQRLGTSTSRVYRCVDNLIIQGDVTCDGFTFICADQKRVVFAGTAGSPGYLRASRAVSGAPFLPIRIIHEGGTGWEPNNQITPDVHGYLIHCRADVQSLEISVMTNGAAYSGVPICTSQKVVIRHLSVESLNPPGRIYTSLVLSNPESYVRIGKLRQSTLRTTGSNFDVGFVGDLGWAYGELDQSVKLISLDNSVVVGLSPKFDNASGGLLLTANFLPGLITLRDSFVTPPQIGLFPPNNVNTACNIERTITFLPQTPDGLPLNEVSIRAVSQRTIVGSPGVSDGPTELFAQIGGNGDSAIFRVWRGFLSLVSGGYGPAQNQIDDSNFSVEFRKFDRVSASVSLTGYIDSARALASMPAATGITITEAQAAAITGISLVASGSTGGTVTISEARTASEVWQYYRQWIATLANFDSDDTWQLNGTEIDTGAWNVTIDNATYTGDMTTTGLITLANGAEFIGTRTDANGTVAPPKTVSITGITAGSRLQIYNVTTATEIVNQIVAGTSYSATYDEGTGYTTGDTVRVRLAHDNGTAAKLPFSGQAVVGSTGWSLLASQQDDAVYNSLGIDGSAVTEFVADYPNIQVDINDPDGSTRVDRLYAWFVHTQSSEDGIRNWFAGIVPEDEANFRIVTATLNLKIDNIAATGVTFMDGRRLYRDDSASPLVVSTTGGGSITFFAGKVYTVATGGSALTPTESAKLMSLPSNTLTTPNFLALK